MPNAADLKPVIEALLDRPRRSTATCSTSPTYRARVGSHVRFENADAHTSLRSERRPLAGEGACQVRGGSANPPLALSLSYQRRSSEMMAPRWGMNPRGDRHIEPGPLGSCGRGPFGIDTEPLTFGVNEVIHQSVPRNTQIARAMSQG